MRALVFTLLLILAVPAPTAQQLAGYTQMINDGRHGTQIEYLTEDGDAFLCIPATATSLKGDGNAKGKTYVLRMARTPLIPHGTPRWRVGMHVVRHLLEGG